MNSDKKKRLIIPVATLMVAIVMMAGVGYAAIISSSYTVDENSIQGGEFKVTIDDCADGSKLFTGVKIPYGVNTTNGTDVKNTVYKGEYVLVENKKVKVTDNTGLNKTYTVNTEVTSPNLEAALGDGKYTLDVTLAESTAGATDSNVKTYTLKVVLNVNVDVDVTAANLTVSDITVKITATHTTS